MGDSLYRLTREQGRQLVAMPESGMGYQVVEARVNGSYSRYLAFNAELLVLPGLLTEVSSARPGVDDLLKQADHVDSLEDLRLLSLTDLDPPLGMAGPSAAGPGEPFAPAPRLLRATRDFEGFARVSAFQDDRRIAADGGVSPGTYATTVEDLRLVPSGFAATGRYALPNPASARYVYIIVPGAGPAIDGGTVRPANSQAGGGVEVCFTNGAPAGSAFRPYQISEI